MLLKESPNVVQIFSNALTICRELEEKNLHKLLSSFDEVQNVSSASFHTQKKNPPKTNKKPVGP